MLLPFLEIDIYIYIYVYHIICLLLLRSIICVAGTSVSVNNHKSNIRNNGGYFHMVKNIVLFLF